MEERIYELAEELYCDENKYFCPICKLNDGNFEECTKCIGFDFHREIVDLERAKEYFGLDCPKHQN